jgi:ankyrin repeat protein
MAMRVGMAVRAFRTDADVEALLQSGADSALADRQGWTPLHFAAQAQHADSEPPPQQASSSRAMTSQ